MFPVLKKKLFDNEANVTDAFNILKEYYVEVSTDQVCTTFIIHYNKNVFFFLR